MTINSNLLISKTLNKLVYYI